MLESYVKTSQNAPIFMYLIDRCMRFIFSKGAFTFYVNKNLGFCDPSLLVDSLFTESYLLA